MSLTRHWNLMGLVLLVLVLGSRSSSAQGLQKENEALKKEIAALRAERAVLQQELKEQQETITQLMTRLKASQAEQVQLREALAVTRKRMDQLLGEMREVLKAKAVRSPEPVEVNPAKDKANPPEQAVEGRITRISKTGNLVQLDLGSDSGLQKGHTLDVVRLGSPPKYLGRVRIVEVGPRSAVASFVNIGKGAEAQKMRVGDTVVSSVREPK